MWIRLNGKQLQIVAPCGCVQAFQVSPEFNMEGGEWGSRCWLPSCQYNSFDLATVAQRATAWLRKARPYEPDLAMVSASSFDLGA